MAMNKIIINKNEHSTSMLILHMKSNKYKRQPLIRHKQIKIWNMFVRTMPLKTAAHFVTFKCFCYSSNNVDLEKVKAQRQKGAGLRILRTLKNWGHNPFLFLRKTNPMTNPITLTNVINMLPKFQKFDNKSFFRVLRKNRH